MDEVSNLVAAQYSAYSYPEPIADIEEHIKAGNYQLGDPSLFLPIFWPEGRSQPLKRLLVAGCGSMQAAVLAYKNPDVEIHGVDLSETSLGHERYLQEKHNLRNLHLYKGDLREVGKLGGAFDMIVSTGVLHHMKDPDEGLKALRDVLDPQGVLHIMVYGLVRRMGVYLLQDVFRRMGLDQSSESVAIVKSVLSSLEKTHFVHRYTSGASDLQHDSGIVDTFLHPQDQAYSVPDVIDFVERCGLVFQGWFDNNGYYPGNAIPKGHAIHDRVCSLPVRDQWAITEKLTTATGCHFFTAHRSERQVPDIGAAFADESFLHWFPQKRYGLSIAEQPSFSPERSAVFHRDGLRFELSPAESIMVSEADGSKTILEILQHPTISGHSMDQRIVFGRNLFDRMWKGGHIVMSKVKL